MKVLGIIAEYNPFHNGHIYHINKAKEITHADYVIAIISGPFTEAGNISIIDKYEKSELSIKYGVDLAIELPVIYAISSAHYFASSAIKLLNKLNIVDYVCFGSECNNIDTLKNISKKIYDNEKDFWNNLKSKNKNLSFAKAREESLNNILNKDEISIIKGSNDILGLEYISTLNNIKSKIKPYLVKRNNNFKSATYIRDSLNNKNTDSIEDYVPSETYGYIKKSLINNDTLYDIIRYKILTSNTNELEKIKDVNEGLENKLKKEIIDFKDYNAFIESIKSKRYEMSKIKRILINTLLDITKDDFNYALNNDILYAHILKCNKNGKELLSEISKKSDIDIITSVSKTESLNSNIEKYLNIDIKAQNIYSIISKSNINKDYTNKI